MAGKSSGTWSRELRSFPQVGAHMQHSANVKQEVKSAPGPYTSNKFTGGGRFCHKKARKRVLSSK